MSSSYSSDSGESFQYPKRLSDQKRPMHEILGRGKVADILLWKNKNLSAAILIGFTIIWFLLEVLEYNFITLLCQTTIVMMSIMFILSFGDALVIIMFIKSIGAEFNERSPQTIPESIFKWVFPNINLSLQEIWYILLAQDLGTFFLAITFLWVLSRIANYFCFLCLATLPAMYDRSQYEIDHLVKQGKRYMKKLYKKIDSKFHNKIPENLS